MNYQNHNPYDKRPSFLVRMCVLYVKAVCYMCVVVLALFLLLGIFGALF